MHAIWFNALGGIGIRRRPAFVVLAGLLSIALHLAGAAWLWVQDGVTDSRPRAAAQQRMTAEILMNAVTRPAPVSSAKAPPSSLATIGRRPARERRIDVPQPVEAGPGISATAPPSPPAEPASPAAPPRIRDGIDRALERERVWSRQNDAGSLPFRASPPHAPAGTSDDASGARITETPGRAGRRRAKVQSGGVTYCIDTPSPDRPPREGRAPEIALPTNCP